MKDMYSFHAKEQELDAYYETAKQAYESVFRRCGLGDITYLTYASGSDFCRYYLEYQTITPCGEDFFYICEDCNLAVNKLIDELEHTCPSYGNKELREQTSIEAGNIFKLMLCIRVLLVSPFRMNTGCSARMSIWAAMV